MELKKVVTVKLDGMVGSITVDADQDSEPSFELKVKIPEVLSEIMSFIVKPKA